MIYCDKAKIFLYMMCNSSSAFEFVSFTFWLINLRYACTGKVKQMEWMRKMKNRRKSKSAHFSHPDTELGSRVREDSKKFSSNSQIQDSGSQSMQKVNTNKSDTTPKSQGINRTIKTSENGKKTHLRYGTKLFLPVSNKTNIPILARLLWAWTADCISWHVPQLLLLILAWAVRPSQGHDFLKKIENIAQELLICDHLKAIFSSPPKSQQIWRLAQVQTSTSGLCISKTKHFLFQTSFNATTSSLQSIFFSEK